MGMDVYGKDPLDETGRYFRNNVWWWRPLANYILEEHPDIADGCEYWHSNDGDGLDAKGSVMLADALDADILAGRVAEYAREHAARLESISPVPCDLCDATGVRSDGVGIQNGMTTRRIPDDAKVDGSDRPHPRAGRLGWCNGCDGRGMRDHWETHYPFSAENVQEFSRFLRTCGGFEIC